MPAGAMDAEDLRRWLVEAIAATTGVPADEIDPNGSFHDLGITSSQAVSVSGELEDLLDQELSPTLLYQYPTIESLARALAGATAEPGLQPAAPAGTATPAHLGADDPVCIVGMSCRFPGAADGPESFWHNLINGIDGAADIPEHRWGDPSAVDSGVYTRRGGFLADVAGFDANFFGIAPAEALRMDPHHRILLEQSWSALENAGLAADGLRGSSTGVFVGMLTNQEYGRLEVDQDGQACWNDPFFGLGVAPSVAAGRLSYALDLRGPSMCVDTACSSSLLAVHLAAQSLLRGECTLALAAGVGVLTHPLTMLAACSSRMLAPDGRTKTFDADADGYLIGEGCGVVVLQRLSEARRQGRPVLAVLRGSAVNQDGHSNGMTAPSLAAQASVIRQALAAASLQPSDIDLVEAHGSGTALGDAIELGALQEVFDGAGTAPGAGRERPLVVGAVKTSVGHLLGAAGIAGLIKTVLALQHAQIPPNLHLREANPAATWDGRPVTLPGSAIDWPTRTSGARLAGVSSFGWSGTNVHLILQAAERDAAADGAAACSELLPLSASSPAALIATVTRLRDHLARHPDLPLHKVARTLQVGRAGLDHRVALVCQDIDHALALLDAEIAGQRPTAAVGASSPSIVFLVPGTGDHQIGMARGLYETQPVFRAAFDACGQALAGDLGLDLATVLYPAGDDPATEGRLANGVSLADLLGRNVNRLGAPGDADQPFARTEVVHAAIFAVDYALARLWQSFGVEPSAIVGYSLGEYVAACLAGVFDLADALLVVVRRARLIAAQPAGAMLAVGLPAASVVGRLPGSVHLAATNGPEMTVVAGTADGVAELENRLADDGVAHLRINNEHPMHTPLLVPVRDALAALVRGVRRRVPSVPFISCRSGDWITPDEAVDPDYWAAQACEPVRFDRGIETVIQGRGALVLLEIGPGQTLTSLAQQTLAAAARTDVRAVPSMRSTHLAGPGADRDQLLRAVGEIWAQGGTVDWASVRPEPSAADDAVPAGLVALPTYPFEHQRFWPDAGPAVAGPAGQRPTTIAETTVNHEDLADWCYAPGWRQAPLPAAAYPGEDADCWLVFADADTAALVDRLRRPGRTVLTVHPGDGFRRQADLAYTIDPGSAEDAAALLRHLHGIDRFPDRVMHAWNVGMLAGSDGLDRLRAANRHGYLHLSDVVRAIARYQADRPVDLTVLTAGMHSVVADEGVDPEKAAILGLSRIVPLEFPLIRCRTIDVDHAPEDQERLITRLEHELSAGPATSVSAESTGVAPSVAYRSGRRWECEFAPVRIPPADPEKVWRRDGVYLITGGFGGLGLILARQLAARGPVRLVLLGRSTVPPRDEWAAAIGGDDPGLERRVGAILELEAAGAQVLAVSADVADPAAVTAAIAQTLRSFGELNGVIHAAGLPAGGLLQFASPDSVERVLRPKVSGTVVLREVLREALAGVPVDFFVAFSSAVVALGGLGEGDYCAANSFLGAYARHERAGGFPFCTVDWGPWQWDSWTGSDDALPPAARRRMRELRDAHGITDDQGFELLTRALASDLPEVMVLQQDLATMTERWAELTRNLTEAAPLPQRVFPRPQLRTPYCAPRTDTERSVCEIWQRYLGVDRVGVDDQFFELGGTSLVGMGIVSAIAQGHGVLLAAADLFQAPTPRELGELIGRRRPDDPTKGAESVLPASPAPEATAAAPVRVSLGHEPEPPETSTRGSTRRQRVAANSRRRHQQGAS